MKPHVYNKEREDRYQRCRKLIQNGPPLLMLCLTAILVYLALAVLDGPALLVGEEPVAFDATDAEYMLGRLPCSGCSFEDSSSGFPQFYVLGRFPGRGGERRVAFTSVCCRESRRLQHGTSDSTLSPQGGS
jgi:hypothetical protein